MIVVSETLGANEVSRVAVGGSSSPGSSSKRARPGSPVTSTSPSTACVMSRNEYAGIELSSRAELKERAPSVLVEAYVPEVPASAEVARAAVGDTQRWSASSRRLWGK